MVSLEKEVEQLFRGKPELLAMDVEEAREEAVNVLREMKDSKTNKKRWHVQTIRNRVDAFLRNLNKTKEDIVVPEKVEKKESPPLKVEGQELEKKPVDPFAIKEEVMKATEKDITFTITAEVYKKISEENKIFKEELLGIVKDMKTGLVDAVKEVKKDVAGYVEKLPALDVVESKYDEIELKQSTIEHIKDGVNAGEFGEDSDYIDSLIKSKGEFEEEISPYRHLVDIVKKAGGKLLLKLTYIDGEMGYEEYVPPVASTLKHGKFGLNRRSLLVGGSIGVAVGVLITLVVSVFINMTPVAP